MKKYISFLIILALTFTTSIYPFFGFESVAFNENTWEKIKNSHEKAKNSLPDLFNYKLANLYLDLGERELAADEVSYAFEKLLFFGEDYFDTYTKYPEIEELFSFYNTHKSIIDEYLDTQDDTYQGEISPIEEIESENLMEIKIDPSVEEKLKDDVKKLKFDFPVVVNKKVLKWMNYFLNGRGYKRLIRGLRRLGKYETIFRNIFKEMGLPQDLIYFGLVESNFNPHAYSRARARGIWQFIRFTARKYGLRVDWWVDERSDPIKSTYAACRYLKDLYNMFGDWYLVLAAYNSGEGRIQRLVNRYGTNDYWKIARKWRLPRETRDYVPLILAAMIIAKNPELFGVKVDKYDPLKYKKVTIPSPTDLRIVADLLKIDVEDLRDYNPQLRRLVTPPDVKRYTLYLPSDLKSEKLAELNNLPKNKRLKWVRHKIRRGETLSKIARMYGSSISAIRDVNNIRNVRRLRIGKILIIPLSPIAKRFRPKYRGKRYKLTGNTYRVRRGDTLWSIARAFGVDVEYLKKVNNLRGKRRVLLKPGMKLIIPIDARSRYVKKYHKTNKKKIYAKESGSIYIVKRGDNLWRISRKFNTTVNEICRANNISKRKKLKPGMKLIIPRKRKYALLKIEKKYFIYKVKRGDNLWRISRKFNVNIKKICKINNITKNTKLKIGKRLKIPID